MTFFFKNFKSGDRKLTLRKKGPLHTLRAPEIEVQVPQRKKESWIPEFKKEINYSVLNLYSTFFKVHHGFSYIETP